MKSAQYDAVEARWMKKSLIAENAKCNNRRLTKKQLEDMICDDYDDQYDDYDDERF